MAQELRNQAKDTVFQVQLNDAMRSSLEKKQANADKTMAELHKEKNNVDVKFGSREKVVQGTFATLMHDCAFYLD